MKKSKLFFSLFFLFAQIAEAQTILFRAPGASLLLYNKSLREGGLNISPVEALTRKLQSSDLSPSLRLKIDTTLDQASQQPDKAEDLYLLLIDQLEEEPQTSTLREYEISLIERVLPMVNSSAKDIFVDRLANLKEASETKRHWNSKESVLSKEISRTLARLKSQVGGEDVALFWNGTLWDSSRDTRAAGLGQWILVSSQWRPLILTGTWAKISKQIPTKMENWVSGDCGHSKIVASAWSNQKQSILFKDPCAEDIENLSLNQAQFFPREESPSPTKIVGWSLAGLALGVVALSLSGKSLRFKNP